MSDGVAAILLRVALGSEVEAEEAESVLLWTVRHRPDLARRLSQRGLWQALVSGDARLAQFHSAMLDATDKCA